MKRNYLGVLLPATLFIMVGAASFDAQPPAEGFQNLKVLPKDITKEKLDSVMDHFCVSLGVKCGFCHAPMADTARHKLDFVSDKKEEKNTAREMYRMTAYINANFFNDDHSTMPDTIHEVVCYSCHRGGKQPDAKQFLSLIDSTVKEWRKKK